MRPILLHIFLLALCLPQLVGAQSDSAENKDSFYAQLGIRDAKHEISAIAMSVEDENDFWKDQRAFEDLLMKQNPSHYQSYLNGKAKVYRQHKIHCGNRCGHSEQFLQQIAFYIINGQTLVNEGVVFSIGPNKGTPKK